MPVSPVLPGRTPETFQFQRLGASLNKINAESIRLQDMAATGVRIAVGSEDPAGAIKAGLMQRNVERNTALQEQLAVASSQLAAADVGLATFGDAATKARTLLQSGIGAQSSQAEKNALADEVAALRQSIILEGNRTFRGRSLFGGSNPTGSPFADLGGGKTLYTGDLGGIPGLIGDHSPIDTAVNGHAALQVLTPAESRPLSPALTLDTPLSALHGGAGVTPGELTVSLDDGLGNLASQTVDLAGARTIGDLKTRLEAAFGAGPPGLNVNVSAAGDGLSFAVNPGGDPAAAVTIADVNGGRFARDLRLVPNPAPVAPGVLEGGGLAPRVTKHTPLTALNGGAGVDVAGGLQIVQGDVTATVDLSSATTVGEALAAIKLQTEAAGVHVLADLNEDGTGIVIRGRVSGVDFSIGENGATSARDLGVSTLPASTRLDELNGGAGIPTGPLPDGPGPLVITRRDGTDVSVDLSGAETLEDVLAAINAVDPGVLTASFGAPGNGLTLADAQVPVLPAVAGPLTVAESELSVGLGLAGPSSSGPAAPGDAISGSIDHPRRTGGLPDLLSRLEAGLRAGDDVALHPLGDLLDVEQARATAVRAASGVRHQRVSQQTDRLVDEELQLREDLSMVLDADLAEVFSRITALQTAYEATLRLTAQANQLSLINFL
ncbi:flagellin N-terminal helical domain-containing protein [Alienimonas californiensis]|uniref:Flagellin n=1 Tax=Alienimonas californiensis TaxID=2527989 RepID=A0A517P3Y5_9PLAN|nr:flagellin [Alienimonas californiensis]QDT14092.1 flagellar hook-associated protein FlgL [Alienimonas californiensis]